MTLADALADRSVRPARDQAEAEVTHLVDAGFAVLRRDGVEGLTVAEVLREAGLSTRAFYRHFQSKDELVLAVFERELQGSLDRMHRAIAKSTDPRVALEAWIDQTLGLAFDPRRAHRTNTLWAEGQRLRARFPEQFEAILDGVVQPLAEILERGAGSGDFPACDPHPDARSIHAVVWGLVQRRLDGESALTRDVARDHAIRFCLGALGAPPSGNGGAS
jgi:AcrR family transcriptional regulator